MTSNCNQGIVNQLEVYKCYKVKTQEYLISWERSNFFWRLVTLEKLLKLADLEDFLNLVIQVNQMILVIFM